MAPLPKVFLCYARKDNASDDHDRRWLDRFRAFLKPHDGEEFEVFHDEQVPPGGEWNPVILEQVKTCHVAVLLVSQHFLGSTYIRDKELPVLLERRRAGQVLVLPLLISACTIDKKRYRFPDPQSGPQQLFISDLQQVGAQLEVLEALSVAQQNSRLKAATEVILGHVEKLSRQAAVPVTTPAPVASKKSSRTPAEPPTPARATLATPDHPWINSLDMRFVAVPGTKALFSVWPTRVRDYRAFADDRGGLDDSWRDPLWEGVPVTPGPDHPVVNVSWQDAQEFCRWLTDREHRQGRLQPGQRYRLPTDREWSAAVGLPEEPGKTPKDRDGKIPGVFPWGTQWPPPRGAGNFADATCKKAFGNKPGVNWTFIEGYDDGFATTSPVGSFQRSSTGLYDLSGNVWEWCEDWFDAEQKYRDLRGGSWGHGYPQSLLSSFRNGVGPDGRNVNLGFRVVLGVDEPAR